MGAQEDYERFKALTDELDMEDDKAEDFVNQLMKRKGHKPVMSWTDAEPEKPANNEPEDMFGNRRKKKEEEAAAKAKAEAEANGKGEQKTSWQY